MYYGVIVLIGGFGFLSRDVLSRQEISPLINPSELGPLLSREVRTALEQQYTNLVQVGGGQR